MRARVADLVNPRGAAPSVPPGGRPLEGAQELELLARPLGLSLLGEDVVDSVTQIDEHLDVEGGVVEPVVGQRSF